MVPFLIAGHIHHVLLSLLIIFCQVLIRHSLPSISFASGGDGVSMREREIEGERKKEREREREGEREK